jgi:hypothetical protein
MDIDFFSTHKAKDGILLMMLDVMIMADLFSVIKKLNRGYRSLSN